MASARPWARCGADARIFDLTPEHGGAEVWTLDRDFARFGDIRAVNPFVSGQQVLVRPTGQPGKEIG